MAFHESMDKIIILDKRTNRKLTRFIWSETYDNLFICKDGEIKSRQLMPYERIIERIPYATKSEIVNRDEAIRAIRNKDKRFIASSTLKQMVSEGVINVLWTMWLFDAYLISNGMSLIETTK